MALRKHHLGYIAIQLALLLWVFLETRRDDTVYSHYQHQHKYSELNRKIHRRNEYLRDMIHSSKSEIFQSASADNVKMSPDLITGEELLVYYAFYETRDPAGPRIRIIATGDCHKMKEEQFLVVLADGKTLYIDRIYVIGTAGCAGGPGGHCKMQEMELSTNIFWEKPSQKITIFRQQSFARVKLHRIHTSYIPGITSCNSTPLYWYNDWPRLMIFIEYWRKTGVHKILMHVHSVSAATRKLLDYYVQQGIVELRPVPLMPYSQLFNPNEHVYHGNVHLTTLFCSIWSNTDYTVVHDVDEIFYVRNKSDNLLDIVHRHFSIAENPNAGALKLQHSALGFKEPIAPTPWNFKQFRELSFLKSAVPFLKESYEDKIKYIYETRFARIPNMHLIREFFGDKQTVALPDTQVAYLEMRNEDLDQARNHTSRFPEFELFTDSEIQTLRQRLKDIFGDDDPPFRFQSILPILEKCMYRLDAEGNDCNNPLKTECFRELKNMDDWLYAVPTEESHFIPI